MCQLVQTMIEKRLEYATEGNYFHTNNKLPLLYKPLSTPVYIQGTPYYELLGAETKFSGEIKVPFDYEYANVEFEFAFFGSIPRTYFTDKKNIVLVVH